MQLTDAHLPAKVAGKTSPLTDSTQKVSSPPSNEWSAVYSATFSIAEEAENTKLDQALEAVKILTVEVIDEAIRNNEHLGAIVTGFEQPIANDLDNLVNVNIAADGFSQQGSLLSNMSLDDSLSSNSPLTALTSNPSQGVETQGETGLFHQETGTGKGDALPSPANEPASGDSSTTSINASAASATLDGVQEPKPVSTPPVQQVLDVTIDQISGVQKGEAKSLSFQLHPAELGQVTVVIDWTADSLNAKILVAEFGTRELLLQGQHELVQALEDVDVGLGSLEIGLQDSHKETPENQKRRSATIPIDSSEELVTSLTGDRALDGAVDVIV